jgi:ubiquitin
LSLCEDHSPYKLGVVGSGIITEAGKQPNDHAAVAIDGALRDSAMMSQPILELGNALINRLRDARRGRLCDATLDQKANEPAYAAHVLGREELMLTIAAAFTSMSSKPRDCAVIDVDKDDLRPA